MRSRGCCKNAAKYGGDPKRCYLMGHSAGAQIVALVGIDPQYLGAHGLEAVRPWPASLRFDGAGYDAAAELDELKDHPLMPEDVHERGFGPRAADLSATRLVKPGLSYPPFLILYTDRDSARRRSDELVGRLHAVGGNAADYLALGKNHMQINHDLGVGGDPEGGLLRGALYSGDALRPPRRNGHPRRGPGAWSQASLRRSPMAFAENNGVRLSWQERGQGTPILLVMGHRAHGADVVPGAGCAVGAASGDLVRQSRHGPQRLQQKDHCRRTGRGCFCGDGRRRRRTLSHLRRVHGRRHRLLEMAIRSIPRRNPVADRRLFRDPERGKSRAHGGNGCA